MEADSSPFFSPETGFDRLHGGIPHTVLVTESPDRYLAQARLLSNDGARLLTLWSESLPAIRAAILLREGLVLLSLSLPKDAASFPSLSSVFPTAVRFERTIHDLFGLIPDGLADLRPWIDHGLWSHPPLSPSPFPPKRLAQEEDYPFVRVRGEGVHEIPVGPVHAGIIEPGHFRFSVVGEKVLRLETRMGYTHKGIARLFRGRSLPEAARLASRISGDSAVATSLAFSKAVEEALDIEISEGVRFVRALLLERERVANHLADLGALGNDAGLAVALSLFHPLREAMHRINLSLFGHRLLFDSVVPGGVSTGLSEAMIETLLRENERLQAEVTLLERIYADHGGLQDRFQNTGILSPEIAGRLGIGGVAGRASGQGWDLRIDHREGPVHRFAPALALDHVGDVASRVRIRFFEIFESLRLTHALLTSFPGPDICATIPDPPAPREGTGIVEGFRGEVLGWVRILPGKILGEAHIADGSSLLWHALEASVPGNLVADFPLINKSFNPSYSASDL